MKMSNKRRELFLATLADGRAARRANRLDEAFGFFERAHVIGQHWIRPHLASHWEMLRTGWMRTDLREVAGQSMRLVLVIPGTMLGRLPEGNTGGANVNAFEPMPMPIDEGLRRLLEAEDERVASKQEGGVESLSTEPEQANGGIGLTNVTWQQRIQQT